MASVTHSGRNALVILNSPYKEILTIGLIIALSGASLFSVLVILFFTQPTTVLLSVAASVLLFVSLLFCSLLYRLEYRLLVKYRMSSGLPLSFILLFVVISAMFMMLSFGGQSVLEALTDYAIFMPVTLALVLSALASVGVRSLFFLFLHSRTKLDFVELNYREQIAGSLDAAIETSKRYGQTYTLVLFRIEPQPSPEAESLWPAREADFIETAGEELQAMLRASDVGGVLNRNTLWSLFVHTTLNEARVPEKRLREALSICPALDEGFKVFAASIRGGCVEIPREADSPELALALALERIPPQGSLAARAVDSQEA